MVLFNLSRLLVLIHALNNYPQDFPKRMVKLHDTFWSFKPTSSHVVSVELPFSLERPVEKNIEDEDDKHKQAILDQIINMFSLPSAVQFPTVLNVVYLISQAPTCMFCGSSLSVIRPDR